MTNKFGGDEFDFLPKSFIFPSEHLELEEYMKSTEKTMIVKPPNWFNGMGIKLINKIGREVIVDNQST